MKSRFSARQSLLLSAVCLALVTACSSGGGGGGPVVSPTPPAPPPPPPPPPPPSDAAPPPVVGTEAEFETFEYFNAEGLEIINASAAYARGATGAGIEIAVIDTGADFGHPDLIGQFSGTFDVNEDVRDPGDIDSEGHGTLVAGVIAARKDDEGIHGAAFGARLIDIRADLPGSCAGEGDPEDPEEMGGCSFSDPDLIEAIDIAIAEGAQIINMSLGGPVDQSQGLENRIRQATEQGVLFVISAGNSGAPATPDPSDPDATIPAEGASPEEPAYLAGDPSVNGLVVAVGAIDRNGKISDFSNRAGNSSQDFYLLAPGERVVTTGPDGDDADDDGDYYFVSGTSFAAPYVSGALALMLESFSNITPETALQILLDTADDYIDPDIDPIAGVAAGQGTDAVSGVGVVNLAAAFTPQGSGTMAFGDEAVPFVQAMAAPSGAFGDWATASGAFDGLMFLDKYNRGFSIAQANLMSADTVMSSLEMRADWAMGEARAVSAGPLSLSWHTPRLADDPTIPYEREPETLYTARFAFDGGLVEFGRGGRLSSIAPSVSLTAEPGSPDPLGGDGSWARLTKDFGDLSVDAFSSDSATRSVSGVGVSRRGDFWVARAAVSQIDNRVSALGSQLQARFGGQDETRLAAYTVEGKMLPLPYRLPGVTVSAGGEAAAVSLPGIEANDVWTSRWSLGASGPLAGGRLSFIVAQPRRAEAGSIRFDGPVAIAEDNTILYAPVTAGLQPSGRQIDWETRWSVPLSARVSGTAAAAIATSPNHVAGAAPEQALWLGLSGKL